MQNDYSPIVSILPSHHLRSKEGRQWKKCPKDEKQKFQNNIINFLTSSFVGGDRKEYFVGKNEQLTLEEKVAKWQFMNMDRNKDGVSIWISVIIY